MEVICINDSNQPTDLKRKDLWVKKGQKYTAINILKITKSNTLGVELEEIDMRPNDPYLFFNINRFAFIGTEEDFKKLIEQSKELNDIDISVLEELLIDENVLEPA